MMELGPLVAAEHTAVLTMELQRGVVGDLAAWPDLGAAAAAVGMPANAGRVCAAARGAGARVVHCTAEFRPDRQGSATNARILAASAQRNGTRLDQGQPGTELIPELDVQPSDLRVARSHGVTPFVATELDQTAAKLRGTHGGGDRQLDQHRNLGARFRRGRSRLPSRRGARCRCWRARGVRQGGARQHHLVTRNRGHHRATPSGLVPTTGCNVSQGPAVSSCKQP